MKVYRELKGCPEGRINSILIPKEVFCTLYGEFCKFIKTCPLGYKRDVVEEE